MATNSLLRGWAPRALPIALPPGRDGLTEIGLVEVPRSPRPPARATGTPGRTIRMEYQCTCYRFTRTPHQESSHHWSCSSDRGRRNGNSQGLVRKHGEHGSSAKPRRTDSCSTTWMCATCGRSPVSFECLEQPSRSYSLSAVSIRHERWVPPTSRPPSSSTQRASRAYGLASNSGSTTTQS